ncbi:XdhC family protein [bacterium LRH843]|nr:XdhC family protein [bacterium LRH843]
MSEMQEILKTIDKWQKDGQQMALATVIKIKGSAYRRPGARMLISWNGDSVGMLGGGCFDADVKEVAQKVIESGISRMHLYQLSDTDVWGLGLGCSGSVFVLIESLETKSGEIFISNVKRSLGRNQSLTVLHQFSKKVEFDSDFMNGTVAVERYYSPELSHLTHVLEKGTYFQELIEPSPRLVIFGAGHDVIPVVEFASECGFNVVVVDQRIELLNRDRFPKAAAFVPSSPELFQDKIRPLENDYVLFMSHNIHTDAKAFNFYRKQPVTYLGFLGPKSRTSQIMHDILQVQQLELKAISHLIYSPVGMDLGAETPEQVAVSIVSELMIIKNRSVPQLLKDKVGTIHDPQPPKPRASHCHPKGR